VARPRILVLGAGFGGLELSASLCDRFGADVDVVLVDRADGFVFGFSKLDVMFGKRLPESVVHPYRDLDRPGLTFVRASITAIEPEAKRVHTDAGSLEGDVLVVALGADLDPAATPGLLDGGHEFYTNAGAFAVRDVLADFAGGRVVVGVTSTPFKCPPAPSETALLMHDHLVRRGIRDASSVTLAMPLPKPVPPSPDGSRALLEAFAERGIAWLPNRLISRLDPERRVAVFADGAELAYHLFLGVPRHSAPTVIVESGLTADGWIPVDPATMATRFPDVYAIGDVTSAGTPKAGVFAEGQARVVATNLIDRIENRPGTATYGGLGTCYVEFGEDSVGRVDVTFLPGQAPRGSMQGPSSSLAEEKLDFGRTRVARWFGREWADEPEPAAR